MRERSRAELQIPVKNAAFVCRVQSVGNLTRQTQRLVMADRTAERIAVEVFED